MAKFDIAAPWGYAEFLPPRGAAKFAQKDGPDGQVHFFNAGGDEVPNPDGVQDVAVQPQVERPNGGQENGEADMPDLAELSWSGLKAEYKDVFGKHARVGMKRDAIEAELRDHYG